MVCAGKKKKKKKRPRRICKEVKSVQGWVWGVGVGGTDQFAMACKHFD